MQLDKKSSWVITIFTKKLMRLLFKHAQYVFIGALYATYVLLIVQAVPELDQSINEVIILRIHLIPLILWFSVMSLKYLWEVMICDKPLGRALKKVWFNFVVVLIYQHIVYGASQGKYEYAVEIVCWSTCVLFICYIIAELMDLIICDKVFKDQLVDVFSWDLNDLDEVGRKVLKPEVQSFMFVLSEDDMYHNTRTYIARKRNFHATLRFLFMNIHVSTFSLTKTQLLQGVSHEVTDNSDVSTTKTNEQGPKPYAGEKLRYTQNTPTYNSDARRKRILRNSRHYRL